MMSKPRKTYRNETSTDEDLDSHFFETNDDYSMNRLMSKQPLVHPTTQPKDDSQTTPSI